MNENSNIGDEWGKNERKEESKRENGQYSCSIPRNIDHEPGWGSYSATNNSDDWWELVDLVGIRKAPTEIQSSDIVGKCFKSFEEAEKFYILYARAMGFGIRKGHLRKDRFGNVKNRTWLCCKEGKREKKYLDMPNRTRTAKGLTRADCRVQFRINSCHGRRYWKVKDFTVDHTHELASQVHVQYMRSNRMVSDGALETARTLRFVGVRTCHIVSYMADMVGGYGNLRFTTKDLYNKMRDENGFHIVESDAAKALGYLQSKADSDIRFFGKFTYDGDQRLENLMWADGQCRRDYERFGDVLAFDTTYKSNAYGKPLLVLVGVNNHFRTCIFALALLNNETTDTYRWALNTFIECMDGRLPGTVLTDGDVAMRTAINELLPGVTHRLCSWHIKENAISNIKQPGFTQDLRRLMFRKYTHDGFEVEWREVIDKFGLHHNNWINQLYSNRKLWADTFLRGHFFAGMSSTQKCERMHSFLKSKGSARFGMFEIVQGMDGAISALRHVDCQEDYESMWTSPVTNVSNLASIEEKVSQIYSRRMFYIFREEMKREGKYIVTSVNGADNMVKVLICKYSRNTNVREVIVDKVADTYACECQLFESKGIPCRHVFSALKALHVTRFPESLICMRWMKASNVAQTGPQSNISANMRKTLLEEKMRFGHVTQKCSEIAFMASLDQKVFDYTVQELQKLAGNLVPMTQKAKTRLGAASMNMNVTNPHVVNDPHFSSTKGGWAGCRRQGGKKKQCSNCHKSGHNKATCTFVRRTGSNRRDSDGDDAEMGNVEGGSHVKKEHNSDTNTRAGDRKSGDPTSYNLHVLRIFDEGIDDKDWTRKGKAVMHDHSHRESKNFIDGLGKVPNEFGSSRRGRSGRKESEEVEHMYSTRRDGPESSTIHESLDFWSTTF